MTKSTPVIPCMMLKGISTKDCVRAEPKEAEEKLPFVRDMTKMLYKKYPPTIKSSPNVLLNRRGRKDPFLFLTFFLRRQ